MKCPYCGAEESKVIDSRPTEDSERIRFASVYQQFADVESFFNELKKLMGDRKK